MTTMHHIKTFANGQRLDYSIEWVTDYTFRETAYIDGVAAGPVRDCMPVDMDGNPMKPLQVGGVTVAATVTHEGRTYCLSAAEAEKVHAIRKDRPDTRTDEQKQAYQAAVIREQERRRKEREWDDLHNEGVDGYNPYRADDLSGTAFDSRERHHGDGA